MNTRHRLLLFVCLLTASLAGARPRLLPINDAAVVAGQSSNPSNFVRAGSQAFFIANDGTHGNEVWRTDGTAAGTRMVPEVVPGPSTWGPWIEGTLGNAVVFTASPSGGIERELWRSDGTAAGTWLLGTLPTPPVGEFSDGYAVDVITADTRVFAWVQMSHAEPQRLLVSDGQAGDLRELGSLTISWQPAPFGKNGKLYFAAHDPVLGRQFMVSDGTAAGTHMVFRGTECPGHQVCGPMPGGLFSIGSTVFFLTPDALWKTNGTAAGTVQVAALEAVLLAAGNTVAYLQAGDRLWRTDGTAAGTRDVGPYSDFMQARMLDDGRLIYFLPAFGQTEVWRSDGTAAGTAKILTLPFGITETVGVSGSRLFAGGNHIARGVGEELWSIDAADATFELVKDLDPRIASNGPRSGAPAGGASIGTRVVFPASDFTGRELWVTDGTPAGTMRIANIAAEDAGGSVSGTVNDAVTGQPLPNASVSLCSTSSLCQETTRTLADGTFRFPGVIPGTYTVLARGALHLAQWYDGKNCPCQAGMGTPVTVSAGFETAGIGFSLARAGSISGRITRLSNGEAIYTEVRARSAGGSVFSAVSAADTGEYRITGLPTGTYTVETVSRNVGANIAPFVDQIHGGQPCLNGCSGGTLLNVTAGQDLPNIDLEVRSYGTISGVVRDKSQPSLPINARIGVWLPGSSFESTAFSTDPSTGAYESPLLRPGTYHLIASGGGYENVIHPDKICTTHPCDFTGATAVTVSPDGTTTGIDFELPQAKARLTGVVHDAGGMPLGGISVSLYDPQGRYVSAFGFAVTDGEGRYVLPNLPASAFYLKAQDELHPNRLCFDNPCNVDGATLVVLTAGQTKVVDMKLLARRTRITGSVLDGASGLPVAPEFNPQVLLQAPDGLPVSTWPSSGVGLDGRYWMDVLSREPSLYVSATAFGFHRKTWPDVSNDCSNNCPIPAGATALEPGTHDGVDFILAPFGTISGRVTDALTGKPVPNMSVRFRTVSGEQGNTFTDPTGRYTWRHAAGSYYIFIESNHHSHEGQVFPNTPCAAECVPSSGTLVSVPDGTNKTGVDFVLAPLTGRIRGRVVDDVTGAGMANVFVSARSNDDNESARTDAQGYYTIDGLTPGPYHLYAETGIPYYTSVFGGEQCPDFNTCNRTGGTAVGVTAANTTANIDFRMIRLRVTSISPAQGPLAGGTRVVVTGTNFTPNAVLTIGGKPASIVSRSATQLVATTPPSAAGAAHVTVTVAPSMEVSLAHGFTYAVVPFTDDPLVAGQTRLRAIHIVELRNAVNALRSSAGLAPFPFTDAIVQGTKARALHILELRTALNQARIALGRPALSYANAVAAGGKVRAADVMELRAGLQ